MDDPAPIKSTDVDISESTAPTQGTVLANAVDITLKNTGDEAAFISEVQVTVLYAKQMQDCKRAGGPVQSSANYSISIPKDLSTLPMTLHEQVSYKVEARTVDRLTVTFGPEQQSLSSSIPWVYAASVDLKYDDSAKPLNAGTAGLLARPNEGHDQLVTGLEVGDFDCVNANAKIVEDAAHLVSTPSSELKTLSEEFSAALTPDADPAKEACQSGNSQGLSISSACFLYTKQKLDAKITVSQDLVPEQHQIMMRISTDEGNAPLRWAAEYYGDEWGAGFIEADDPATIQWSGHGCGTCQVTGDSREVELSIPPAGALSTSMIYVSVELQDISDPTHPVTLTSLNDGQPVAVSRGH